ncbi:MAG: hypothetical protein CSA82_01900 [Actinobacteria bacterium]|nr:MAG: hypothetical protein CSA82_01900 [Actinomycetota bacterium]
MSQASLFTPICVGPLSLRNRLWMPPMCQYSADSEGEAVGRPQDYHLIHYGARALGGVGAVIVEATGVTLDGRITPHCLALHDDASIPAFSRLAQAIHAGGAAAFLQLNHAGRKGSGRVGWSTEAGRTPREQGGWQTVAPSAIPFIPDDPPSRQLAGGEINALIEAFTSAARRAIEAGFDGIQIHGAHGYLVHQFLSPASNERHDKWGGGFSGRTRFLREIVRSVRQSIADAPLLVRLSATDWTAEYPDDGRPGWTLKDTQMLTPLLIEDGVDMLCISTGGNVADADIHYGVGYQVFAAQGVREALDAAGKECAVSACGLIRSPEHAEQILRSGQADVIEIGRPMLTDPMLPHEWRQRLGCDPELPVQYLRGTAR